MNLNEWAMKWNIPFEAVNDLRETMGVVDHGKHVTHGISEAAVTSRVLLEASQKNIWLLRNNVGAVELPNGRVLRYGLANESKQQNQILKSSDLIGIRPVLITERMIGHLIGQFVAREMKPENWRYTGIKHEIGQLAFHHACISRGADACFANKVGTL